MRRSGTGSGGGYGSRPVTHRSAPKREPTARAKSPGGVGQIGNMQGNHVTSTINTPYRGEGMERGPGYNAPVGPTSNMGQGPGANRTNHGQSGSQGCHGPVNPGARGLPSARGQWPDSNRNR
jgi:hypothetical protein